MSRDFTPHSHIDVDLSNIDAGRLCGRCGQRWNYEKLVSQYIDDGAGESKTVILVCPKCLDEPSFMDRARYIHDDYGELSALPGNSISIDGSSDWTLRAPPGYDLFSGITSMFADLHIIRQITVSIEDASFIGAYFKYQAQMSPTVSDVSSIVSTLKYQAHLSATLSDVSSIVSSVKYQAQLLSALSAASAMIAALDFVKAFNPSFVNTSEFVAALKYQVQLAAALSVSSACVATLYQLKSSSGFLLGGSTLAETPLGSG